MIKKFTLVAMAFAALVSANSMASAQPGLANLGNVAPTVTEQAGGIVKVGFRRRGIHFRFRHRHHWRRHWRPHYAHYGRGCYRYLRRYHRTGNYYWKKKFHWCRYY
ncbi:MAG: hypothetical protein AAGB04_10115 [Pseudomonadota bacterium]